MKKNNKKGFTLAELLVVVAIIAILVAVAIPTFNAATKKAEYGVELANSRSAYGEAKVYYISNDDSLTGFTSPTYDGITYTVTTDDGDAFTVTLNSGKQIDKIIFHQDGTYDETRK